MTPVKVSLAESKEALYWKYWSVKLRLFKSTVVKLTLAQSDVEQLLTSSVTSFPVHVRLFHVTDEPASKVFEVYVPEVAFELKFKTTASTFVS